MNCTEVGRNHRDHLGRFKQSGKTEAQKRELICPGLQSKVITAQQGDNKAGTRRLVVSLHSLLFQLVIMHCDPTGSL